MSLSSSDLNTIFEVLLDDMLEAAEKCAKDGCISCELKVMYLTAMKKNKRKESSDAGEVHGNGC